MEEYPICKKEIGHYNELKDKARGMLIGLAIGDALGAPVEVGYTSQDIVALGDKIEYYHEFKYPAGSWTDDTSMALCLADSLIEKEGYDSYDIMEKYMQWWIKGYRSSVGHSIGIGQQTAMSLLKYTKHSTISKNEPKTHKSGNGAIMRLAPIIIANTHKENYETKKVTKEELNKVTKMAVLSCRETHNSTEAEQVTELFATLLYYIMRGRTKEDIKKIVRKWNEQKSREGNDSWIANIKPLIELAFFNDPEKLQNLWGYIVHTFTIALWGLLNFDNFRDGMLAVIRLGGDTDTNAACYGQLAGAYYGYGAIPRKWSNFIYASDEIDSIAHELLEMKKCPILRTRFEDDEYFAEIKPCESQSMIGKGNPAKLADYLKNRQKNFESNK